MPKSLQIKNNAYPCTPFETRTKQKFEILVR